MKYLILSVCFLLASVATAQHKMEDLDKTVVNMAKLFKLDETQTMQYKDILKSKWTAINELNKMPMKSEDSKIRNEAIQKEYYSAFEKILRKDQYEIFQQHKKIVAHEQNLKQGQHLKIKETKPTVKVDVR